MKLHYSLKEFLQDKSPPPLVGTHHCASCANDDEMCGGCPWLEKIINRLGAYEDTGLEPETCAEYKKFEDEAVSKGVTFKRIIELMEAEKDGRLVVLPCRVLDTVYRVVRSKDGGGHISPAVVSGIHMADTARGHRYQKGTEYVVLRVDGYYCYHVDVKKFGKTVFLTREEAEAALKGCGGE